MTKKLFFSVFFLLVWGVGSSGYAKQTEMKDVPNMLQSLISAKMGEDNPAYQVQADGDLSYVTKNQKHGLTMKVCPEGMTVQSEGGLNWGTKLKGFGLYKKIESRSNRIEVEFGDITEWFINGPSGIEQGWTLKRNTSSHSGNKDAEEIVIQLAQSGNTRVAAAAAKDLEVKKDDGSVFLRYGGLFAHDAEGKELQARFEMAGGDILVRVDGRNAVYPVTIDPYVRTAILKASVPYEGEELGTSVAISSDGLVVAAGAPYYSGGEGRVYVFVKGDTWGLSAKLTAATPIGYPYLGWSVAISGNGNVIAAGAPDLDVEISDNNSKYSAGGVYVFVKGDTWNNTETKLLTAATPEDNYHLGWSVAINYDGSVIAAGAVDSEDAEYTDGSVYVFVKGDGTWLARQPGETKQFVGTNSEYLGISVAISDLGDVIVAGADSYSVSAPSEVLGAGGVHVFEKGGGCKSNLLVN